MVGKEITKLRQREQENSNKSVNENGKYLSS